MGESLPRIYLWLPVLCVTLQWPHLRKWRRFTFFWNSLQSPIHHKAINVEICFRQTSPVSRGQVKPDTSSSTEGVSRKLNAKHAYIGECPALERDRKPNPYSDSFAAHKQILVQNRRTAGTHTLPHPFRTWVGHQGWQSLPQTALFGGGVVREVEYGVIRFHHLCDSEIIPTKSDALSSCLQTSSPLAKKAHLSFFKCSFMLTHIINIALKV